jgi:UDP-N-acetylglucosamine--N-acetylmuramyl-(pentapeptide) pyrophosphoryl-undecaprenol N-acetylglucosamine transferase
MMPVALELMAGQVKVQVRHQTGVAHAERVAQAYGSIAGIDVEVLPYIENMAGAYDWADLVLCRAGALTLAELTIMACPSVLVPLPHAIDNHQLHNAEWLVSTGAAMLLPQSEMTAQRVAELLLALLGAPTRLQAMADAARGASAPNASRVVASICEEVANEH